MKYSFSLIFLFLSLTCFSQIGQDAKSVYQKCLNPEFEQKVEKSLSHTVPELIIEDFAKKKADYLILDAREKNEYNTSHIPGAYYFGYDNYNTDILEEVDKDQMIVVYCSIGYRSEKIAEKLEKMGFKYVYNLFGSIFEWANQGHELIDADGMPTFEIHTYNKRWSKWVDNPDLIKVW